MDGKCVLKCLGNLMMGESVGKTWRLRDYSKCESDGGRYSQLE